MSTQAPASEHLNGAADATPLVELHEISKSFPGVRALKGVSFAVRRGDIHAVVGENGAGKSTVMKILAGVHQPESGRVAIRGEQVRITSPIHAQQLGITTIYQERTLAPHLTALENMFLGREITLPGMGRRAGLLDARGMRERVASLCQDFAFAPADLDRPVSEFGALKQHVVEILKALAFDADLVIMDEPTAALAEHEREALFERMRRLKRRGVTVLWVTHRLEELVGLADEATVLRDGRFVATVDPQSVDTAAIVRLMIGRDVQSVEDLVDQELAQHAGTESRQEVLRVERLRRGNVLRDISFTLHRGEILGIGGLAGAGRTELARAILGVDKLESGVVYVDGRAVRLKSAADALRVGIAMVPEERKTHGIIGDFSVAENISASSLRRVSLGRIFIDRRREARVATDYVERMAIRPANPRQKMRFLSGGNQQKAVIARSLFARPKVLIFDEPTQGVDVGAKVELYRLIGDFAQSGGAAIVISSELPELCGLSDRVLVMRQGRLEGEVRGYRGTDSAQARQATEERIMQLAAAGQVGDAPAGAAPGSGS
ncbi:MAG: sugar ABC transporter ATP-binding protein [Solirubrobacteraceae bacterium]